MNKMDSFLEEPRSLPRPTPIVQEIEQPTVPEVSLMFQNHKKDKTPIPINFGKTVQSYNAWKLRKNAQNNQEYDSFLLAATNKENLTSDKSFLNKKQVRFENSVSHYPITKENVRKPIPPSPLVENVNNKEIYNAGHCSPSTLTSSPLRTRQTINLSSAKIDDAAKLNNTKPFENLYISNIPNRELDLSFLEPQKAPCPSIKTQCYNKPTKTFEYQQVHKPTSSETFQKVNVNKTESPVKTLSNFEMKQILNPEPVQQSNVPQMQEQQNVTLNTTSNTTQQDNLNESKPCNKKKNPIKKPKPTKSDSGTVNELLNIIKLQNEQLQKLQTQVDKLVQMNVKSIEEKIQKTMEETIQKTLEEKVQKAIESTCTSPRVFPETCEKYNKKVMCQDQQDESQKITENNKKISVGMMTSFEFSFKPPPGNKKKNKKNRYLQPVDDEDFFNIDYKPTEPHKPKKQEQIRKYKKEHKPQHKKQLPQQLHQQKQQKKYFQQTDFNQQPQQQFYQEQQCKKKTYPNEKWNYNRPTQETEYSLGPQDDLEIHEPPESPENSIHIDMQEYDTDSSDDECSTDEGWTFYKDILGNVHKMLDNSRPNCKTQKPNKNYNENYNNCTLDQIKLTTMKQLQTKASERLQIKPTEISFAVKQILMKYLPDEGLSDVVTQPDRKPTDISVAAFKYMQQCNYGRNNKKGSATKCDPKILDITTLKQQPKFL